MAKRFTDSEKWNDPWFRQLAPNHKLAWLYLCDQCDLAGIIELDRELADFQIGTPVDWEGLFELSAGRIERISNGKLWLLKFIGFQYGQLSPESKPHQAVITRLEKLKLWQTVSQRLLKGSKTLKDKDKAKDKAKEGGGCKGGANRSEPTAAEVAAYCRERGNTIDPQSFCDFYESKGWMVGKNHMKDWKACVRTWERRETNQKKPRMTPL